MGTNCSEPARLTESDKVLRYMLAGNATFTIVSGKTGTRFTYKVRASDDGKLFFVSLLTGANNEADYEYIGTIFSTGVRTFRHGKKSRVSADAPSVKAFGWFLGRLAHGVPETVEFFHSGRCGRCARKLTVPESIQSGLGPECAEKGM